MVDYCSPPVGSSHRRRRVRGKEEERGRGREQAVTGRAAVTVEMQTVYRRDANRGVAGGPRALGISYT